MTTDPHDDYYARKQAHRAEVADWIGLWRGLFSHAGPTLRKVLAFAAVLLPAVGSASAEWLRRH